MNRSHEHVLADIEQKVQADGVPLDEVDAAIADVLGVPADYYFAYLLVWGAIEAYTHLVPTKGDGRQVTAVEPALDLAASLTDEIGRLAASIHDASERRGTPQRAARILGCVLELRQLLRDLHPGGGPMRTDDEPVEATGRG